MPYEGYGQRINMDPIRELVAKGAELDLAIKRMTSELNDIKDTIRKEYAKTGNRMFLSLDNEAVATVVVKSRSTISPRAFYKVLRDMGRGQEFFDAVTVTKTAASKILSAADIKSISEVDEEASITVSFAMTNK